MDLSYQPAARHKKKKMKQITKQIASDVARKMVCATIGKSIEALKKEIGARGDEMVRASIPSIIFDVMGKYPGYISKTNGFRLVSDGLECQYRIFANTSYPSNGGCGYFEVNRTTLDWFISKGDELKKLESEACKMRVQIEKTLLALRTPKRVAEDFEAAMEYLPIEKEEARISLPIEELNVLINKYK